MDRSPLGIWFECGGDPLVSVVSITAVMQRGSQSLTPGEVLGPYEDGMRRVGITRIVLVLRNDTAKVPAW